MSQVRALQARALRGSGWAWGLLAAAACGGIAQDGGPRNDDPFSSFEPQQPNRRGGGGRRGGGAAAPPAFGAPGPMAPAPGAPAPLPRLPRPEAAPAVDAPLADAGSSDTGSDTGTAPLTCEPGALRCNGAMLEVCTVERQIWLAQQRCSTSCLCEIGLAAGNCAVSRCVAGEVRCEDSLLERCNECQTGYELIADCGSAAACNPEGVSCDLGGAGQPTDETAPPEEPAPSEPEAPVAEPSSSDAGSP